MTDPPEPPKADSKPDTKPPGGSETSTPQDERGAATVIDFHEASDRLRRKGPHRQMFENLWMLLTFFLAAFMGYLIGAGMQVIGRNIVAGWET